MARVGLPDPPRLGPRATYRDYRPWLLETFFDHLCSYCLTRDDGVEVDHYEPSKYKPERLNDPGNLLLACGMCNGRGGKSDYHPGHTLRSRLPRDTSGHLVVDVRTDDFATMFVVGADGTIGARGVDVDRALWNIVLLKLDLAVRVRARREVIDLHDACEEAVTLLNRSSETVRSKARTILDRLMPQLEGRLLFMRIFDLAISPLVEGEFARRRT